MSGCALVFGASGTLGRVVSERFQEMGFRVLGTGFSRKPALENTLQFDAVSPKEIRRFDEWLEGRGWGWEIDVAVHCIGMTRDGLVVSMKPEDWKRVLDVNLKSVLLLSQVLLKRWIKQRRGNLIVVGSWAGRVGRAGQANYAASKAALIGWVRSFAREYASRGILANVVVPGVFESEMTRELDFKERKRLLDGALAKEADLEEMARFIVSLSVMKGVTGQVFQLDSRMGT